MNVVSLMTARRAVIVVIVLGSLAAWIAAAATSGVREVRPEELAPRVAGKIDASGAALAAEIARLHDRLRPTATPRLGRDLFQFAPRPVAVPTLPPPIVLPAAPARAAELPPPLTLIGVAQDGGEGATTRTAIISSPGQLFLVKEGDELAVGGSRYRVGTISTDAAELVAPDQSIRRLALK
jgi:hypothetical protein